MSNKNGVYLSPSAVESAIREHAKAVHVHEPNRNVDDTIRQIHYDRFLCRVFSEGAESDWVLKGGSAMLARIPSTRRTLDIDIFRNGYDLDESLADLKRLAAIDLHDYFTFVFDSVRSISNGDNQPYLTGINVSFKMFLGAKQLENVNIDLVEHTGKLDIGKAVEPRNRVKVGQLSTFPYRLYPIANQFADKVCAVVELVNGRESTRVKDLVDLTIILTTQSLNASELYRALFDEANKRKLNWPLDFRIPKSWTDMQFRKSSKNTGAENYSLGETESLAQKMLNRLYELGESSQAEWSPEQRKWLG
ncbi:nucleotidyl transferase AbiEii/AbiGii toxin family protein [Bifidobacterium sp. ESL0728]|uniref:nucleotidyl transferase AbiEii/AbiGii toxin family protein n=1 Tax=Bifidobacterium sp. ESL0728 TaxID=2983220 RepID=UPI0023F772B3|nr:nucleotidyl transferase AbiEii/AbiGii toxin family protein [Bifidobacterium sp. ESL0728]WEV59546.1 nucleotidyl transferase AbiEii/AbiGii toxin family protein [Bifidobacterium sp. ESL0728]